MEKKNILKNKYYLYLTEFFAGMSVMAVELGASRLLAPYFSSSQIVWTIIIGTIMIAMALGNIWGGKSADKDPNPDKLYLRIMAAAIWIAAIPLVGKHLIVGISGLLILTVNTNFLILAAFITCMVIFVFPLFLLGTVTPSLVKYTVDSLDESGKTVGTLEAFNTIGSILGTFLPTFVTIPTVGTSVTFLIFSGILLCLGLIYFISTRKKKLFCLAAVVVFLICSIFGHFDHFAFWEDALLVEDESIYNYLQVKEDPSSMILSTNVLFGVQSIRMKDDALTGMYYDYALAAPLMADISKKDKSDVLILGMGTGTYAAQCRRYFNNNNMNIEGVEIDEKITKLAHKYFELPDDIRVTTYDGRAYLQAVDKKYDVIMVDAYQDITIPFQMSSEEFFHMVKDHLKEDGVMVVNMNMHSDGKNSINEYLQDTIGHVFSNVYTTDVKGSTNRELFAMDHGRGIRNLEKNSNDQNDPALKALMQDISETLTPYQPKGHLLTDDKAPVELLGIHAIDGLIKDEIGYYKEIFKKEGMKGLINQL
ncbi:fused MFS/spermidine synthase [Blautia liquoris]|uniref:Fused MFS/spermidine synthase n=1 Tax=Blautia liquoris TaxID=2779518 RepID=A0A7M2RL01_9FIRM|nr:fused MFS/spermidine synthase [Blautia liquoris]QOV20741.1 fused MFS/spermidine synthase [Blautia liquoris]